MNIKENIEVALDLHKKKDIQKMDVLSGDEDIARILKESKDDVESLIELKEYFSHEIGDLLPEPEIYEQVSNDVIDDSINDIINSIENDFVRNELNRLNNSNKKKIRSKMMSNILSENNNFYLGFIELLHLASLIQDDVIDKASTRRFIQTTNAKYNDQVAILTSDMLLIELMHQLNVFFKSDRQIEDIYYDEHYDLFLQMINSEKNTNVNSIESYFEYIRGKTSNLFAVSLANSYAIEYENNFNINEFKDFFDFGIEFGNTFQIIDDYKDYYSSEDKTGKTKTDKANDSPNCFNFVKGDTFSHRKFIKDSINKLKIHEKAVIFNDHIMFLEHIINHI